MPYRPKNSRFWHYDFQVRGCRFHGSCGTEDFEEAQPLDIAAETSGLTPRSGGLRDMA